jgi:hypothetical protein
VSLGGALGGVTYGGCGWICVRSHSKHLVMLAKPLPSSRSSMTLIAPVRCVGLHHAIEATLHKPTPAAAPPPNTTPRELERNLAMRVEPGETADAFVVSGRGTLHLGVLIESMRREGYEFEIGPPKVCFDLAVRAAWAVWDCS